MGVAPVTPPRPAQEIEGAEGGEVLYWMFFFVFGVYYYYYFFFFGGFWLCLVAFADGVEGLGAYGKVL